MLPKVSVLVPVYNKEKYVKRCLESVLKQTMDDFEVIVIDDFSTDDSFSICESMQPLFDGRMKLVKQKKNPNSLEFSRDIELGLGSPGIPRNTALRLSKGKYVCFLDADDYLLDNALEERCRIAEDLEIDVLHEEKFYQVTTDVDTPKLIKIDAGTPSDMPAFVSLDRTYLVKEILSRRFNFFPWNKTFRRDFLMENDINFPVLYSSEDDIFCIKTICLAKRYVRFVGALYVHRAVSNSVGTSFSTLRSVQKSTQILYDGVCELDKFMRSIDWDFDSRYAIIDYFVSQNMKTGTLHLYERYDIDEIDMLVRKVLEEKKCDNPAFVSYLFHSINTYRALVKNRQKV